MRTHGTKLVLLAAVFAVLIRAAAARAGDEPPAEYLSDGLSERIVSVTQGWGELGFNTSVRPLYKPAMKLRIKDKDYQHGLGHHASGEIAVELGGQFKTFQTDVGIQWQGGQNLASVIFRVYVDDKKVFDSGVVRENDPPRHVSVSVEGAEELRLVADDAGDGITCDCANWADARLVRNPAAANKPMAAGVDITPFGKVATWAPQQMGGTKAGRGDEMPAEDIYPAKDLLPAADGTYTVPDWAGTRCIGLRWDENRLLRQLVLQFPSAAEVPPVGSIRLQYWAGESAWQGAWQPQSALPEKIGSNLVWSLGRQGFARGTQKVRWLFPGMRQPVVLAGLSAYTRSIWNTVNVRIESTRPSSAPKAEIELYNGVLLGPAGSSPYHCTWDPAKPLELKIRSSTSKRYKADRTVLRFQFPETAFAVAIEDLTANDCVYVPHAGLFVTRMPAPVTLGDYLKKIAAQSSVLAQVHKRPDQDFARAMAVVHNPIQDLGPMMLSLACDNRKFVVQREGTVVFDEYTGPDDRPRDIPNQWQLVPRFGSGKNARLARKLHGSWIPMPETTVAEGDVEYRQTTYVAPCGEAPSGGPAWLRERALGVAQYVVQNGGSATADAALGLTFAGAAKQPLELQKVPEGLLVVTGGRVLALIDTRKAAPLAVKTGAAGIVVSGTLPGGTTAECSVYIPAWKAAVHEFSPLAESGGEWARRTELYWSGLLEPAMQIELPDPLLTAVIRASQVHCMLAARNEDHGRRVSPWISSDRYGPLESEANSIIRGMDMTGHGDFARRSLDFFIHRYNQAGYLTTGYTMVGTGEHLWTLAEHYQRTHDRAWMQKIAPEVARVCQWIVHQRAKTKRLDACGRKVPEYGLMPPGVTADWNRYAYRFFNDAQYCAGLESAAGVLAVIGHPAAAALLADAKQYREDLLRAYHWTQARSPVVRLDNGTWVPDGSAMLDCFGRTDDFLPGEDGNRSWCYCVEVGAHHLAATKIFDPAAEEVSRIADYLEDVQFLRSGMGDYPEEKNRKDVFCFGGFPKVQPYYGRIAEVYALRDDVKAFVRSYFNTIPTLLSRENLSFWEHFHNTAGWNKTHETGWFLCQSRIMLVMERGDELWLAPMVTNHWMKDGMKVAVRNAPTRFGKVSYTITSAAVAGRIEAVIEPMSGESPARIVIRLRHPEGKPMQSVAVQGKPHTKFDPQKETVTIEPAKEAITVRAEY
jgi:hypothetical protein